MEIRAIGELAPRLQRGVSRIEISRKPVAMRGEKPSEIWWRGKQWAVTAYGVECLDGTYHFEKKRLLENMGDEAAHQTRWWPHHMAEKEWVDIDEFVTAWLIAILLHRQDRKADIQRIQESFTRLLATE